MNRSDESPFRGFSLSRQNDVTFCRATLLETQKNTHIAVKSENNGDEK